MNISRRLAKALKYLGSTWTLRIAGASLLINMAIGIGKIVLSIISSSFFIGVSAFYTFALVLARIFALLGSDSNKERCSCFICALILIGASILYIIYSIRLFFTKEACSYHQYAALAIATVTFVEIGVNARGVVQERRNHRLFMQALKMVNLASSLISLTLTQAALLSLSEQTEGIDRSLATGFLGFLMGTSAAVIGVLLLIKTSRKRSSQPSLPEPCEASESALHKEDN